MAAIVLAAGESRRMGELNKLELPVQGVALLRRSVQMLLESSVRDIVVVVGHEAETARGLIEDLPVTIVHNEHYRDGQMTSVHAGLAAVDENVDGILVCLADQPLLEVADIEQLIAAFDHRERGSVVVPVFDGKRGNPIILAADQRATILTGKRNLGCKHLIDNNPELVCTVTMHDDHTTVDLDTPGDYTAALERLGGSTRRAVG